MTILDSINSKKAANSLKTLCLISYCLLKKGGVIENILDHEELKTLFKKCHDILDNEILDMHDLCLKLLLIFIVTPSDNLNENLLIEYLMNENIFESLIKLVQIHSTKKSDIGTDVVLIIILLANYRKNECRNPYIVQLSIFANEAALISFAEIINNKLLE